MASGSQQLATDFEQVQAKLQKYPVISIIETEGDPPDRYDIEYHVKGYRLSDDGTATPENRHKVRITLPFGYPHFPPTAKPLTPVFHPDIDPDAIRIADFWQDNKSLAELIIHIGRMICGISYQKEQPFNPEAFDWYQEHRDLLPFDTLDPAGAGKDELPAGKHADENDELTGDEEQQPGDDFSESEDLLDILKDDSAGSFEGDDLTLALDLDEGDEEEYADSDFFSEAPAEEEIDLTATLDLEEDEYTGTAGTGSDEEVLDVTGEQEKAPLELDDLAADDEEDEPFFAFGQEEEAGQTSVDPLSETAEKLPAEEEMPAVLSGAEPDEPETAEIEPQRGQQEEDNVLRHETPAEEESGTPSDLDAALKTETVEEKSLAGLQLEDELQEEQGAGRGSGKIRSIRPLIEQKKIFTAKKVLADVSDPASIPDLEEMEEQITNAVAKAEDLYRKADKLEQGGELEKAGLTLDLVANVAVDYPGLEFARNRIRDSLLAGDSRKEAPSPEDGESAAKTVKKKKIKIGRVLKLPYRVIAVVVVLIGVLAAATLITIRDSQNIKLAYSDFQKAEQFLENKEFKEAKTSLDAASSALDRVVALQKDEKEKLRRKINGIADSDNFKEGLEGRVLYDGKYVTVEMARNIDKLNNLLIQAETQQNSGNIDQALKLFDQAGETAKQIGFDEQENNIRQTVNSLQLKKALSEARKAEEEQEWKQAADTYAKALELSGNLSSTDDTNEIATRLAAASFRHELVEGQRAFTASDWQKTIEMLQRAEKILEANPQIASAEEKEEIHTLLIYSRLYHILSGAKNAFDKQEWDMAVDQYKNAIYLLDSNRKILGDKASIGMDKIDKTILMTEVARAQHMNSTAVEKNDLQVSLESYRTIASLIDTSHFKDDEVLRKIRDDAKTQMAYLENEIKINSRIDWLKQNYEEIFRKMYPSAKSSQLLNPEVTFVREEGNNLIFAMGCVEKKQGRSFRLELNYQYDQKKNEWSIYSGRL